MRTRRLNSLEDRKLNYRNFIQTFRQKSNQIQEIIHIPEGRIRNTLSDHMKESGDQWVNRYTMPLSIVKPPPELNFTRFQGDGSKSLPLKSKSGK